MNRLRKVTLMASVLVGLASLGGCGQDCTLRYAPSGFELVIKSPSGAPHAEFIGTASWESRTQAFECLSSGSDRDGQYLCSFEVPGSVRILTDDPPRAVDVTVNAVNNEGSFTGTIELPEPREREVNGPGCGVTRVTTAELILQ